MSKAGVNKGRVHEFESINQQPSLHPTPRADRSNGGRGDRSTPYATLYNIPVRFKGGLILTEDYPLSMSYFTKNLSHYQ